MRDHAVLSKTTTSSKVEHRFQSRHAEVVAQQATMWRWYRGAVVPWCGGTVVRWCGGAVVRWYSGAVVPWCGGAVVRWYSGAGNPKIDANRRK